MCRCTDMFFLNQYSWFQYKKVPGHCHLETPVNQNNLQVSFHICIKAPGKKLAYHVDRGINSGSYEFNLGWHKLCGTSTMV